MNWWRTSIGASMIRQGAWSVLPLVAIAAVITTLPTMAAEADDRGLPGKVIAFTILIALCAGALYVVSSMMPSIGRRRAMSRSARSMDLQFTRRFALPHSASLIPMLSMAGESRMLSNLVSGRSEHEPRIAFDCLVIPEAAYAKSRTFTCAFAGIMLWLPTLVIERGAEGLAPYYGLQKVGFESVEFDERYRVWTEDARAANALVDQQLMMWLLELPGSFSFEAAGGRVIAYSENLDAVRLPSLFEPLDGFIARIPRAARSLYGGSLPSPSVRGTDTD